MIKDHHSRMAMPQATILHIVSSPRQGPRDLGGGPGLGPGGGGPAGLGPGGGGPKLELDACAWYLVRAEAEALVLPICLAM